MPFNGCWRQCTYRALISQLTSMFPCLGHETLGLERCLFIPLHATSLSVVWPLGSDRSLGSGGAGESGLGGGDIIIDARTRCRGGYSARSVECCRLSDVKRKNLAQCYRLDQLLVTILIYTSSMSGQIALASPSSDAAGSLQASSSSPAMGRQE